MKGSDIDKEEPVRPELETPAPQDRATELRRLILGTEQSQIKALQERLDDPDIHASDLSKSLPQALILSSKQGNKLTTALIPTVEEIVKLSVKRDQALFADALFPVMGPAIRKAISEAFKQMVQSLNTALEQSLSWEGLQWRIEAIRTGKPFAEIVLLHLLVYRVEQVFLIHKESGLLLQHVATHDEAFQDADLVSGMLTAIQDFVHDSFNLERQQNLNTVQIGEVALWIEQGPDAIIAGAIRGHAPEDLRVKFKDALESIHLEKQTDLTQFEGDATKFESIRHYLEACLETQLRKNKKKVALLLPLLVSILIIGLGFWGALSYKDRIHQTKYLADLASQKGIVITEVKREGGRVFISGLKDPLAINPETLVSKSNLNPEKVIHRFKPYQSLDPDFILERAKMVLQPPNTVKLTLQDGVLMARGSASHKWIVDARRLVPALLGIQQLSEDHLVNTDLRDLYSSATVNFDVQGSHLTAHGTASNEWIRKTRKRVKSIAGIDRYTDTDVLNLDAIELNSVIDRLESLVFPFQFNTTGHALEQANDLNRIKNDVQHFIKSALAMENEPFVEIVGHTDRSGSKQRNMELSLARAIFVKEALVSNGISLDYLGATGVGWQEPIREEITEADKEMNRSITLKLYLNGPPSKGF